MTKRVIDVANRLSTVQELIDALNDMVRDKNVTYIRIGDGGFVSASLVEETLTDGSVVYDIVLSPSRP